MNLVSVRLITDDVARLVAFYERVTGVAADRATEDFAELRTTSGTLAIGSTRTVALFGAGVAEAAANRTAIVEFLVEDLDARYAALRTDGPLEVVQEPTTMPWGNRSLLLRDPDGTLVNLFEPVTEAALAKFAATPR
ncbi:VOC family protein [Actinomycetospora sp. TBRC 11914]|uniref:VOC family protein n=1 Tax=Actinomycetospora sp. TBRC 11914 TaxID=2729387 RepID=UPI00145E7CB8|nr:VOC family protein [Actinomycetospora sp. TBRC 11914]NMO88542.1 VOC family protein [Actinomycetospora sp. TBRC 11914]